MNAIEITKKLEESLVDYLATTFDVNKDGKEAELAYEVRKSFERSEALFNGPFLELVLPYKTDSSIRQLCGAGVFSKSLLDLDCFNLENPKPIPLDTPLYTHQVKAIKKLCVENKSVVVSAGTGSGKTEGFSLPIISDLLEDSTPGVRALLVYPLNALVNDQLDRLRVLLKGTNITFGRYTGELPENATRDSSTLKNEIISREEIWGGRIPQILITNYAMLEYLLIRPDDKDLFQSGRWKYLVLDEAHTYSGAKGIEVAMLVRRLKERLSKKNGDMLCVATSATLVNDDAEKATIFARNLFGEEFENGDIIFGETYTEEIKSVQEKDKIIPVDIYLHPDFDDLIDEVRKDTPNIDDVALRMYEIGILDDGDLKFAENFQGNISGFLYKILEQNHHIKRLRNWMMEKREPVKISDASKHVFDNTKLDESDLLQALYHLVELGVLARPNEDELPLLPAKYHLFARPPQGIWVCINPNCSGKNGEEPATQKWSKLFSAPRNYCDSCGETVYPINLCRQCGQIYIATHKKGKEYLPASDQLEEDAKKQYFTWNLIEENFALSSDEDEKQIETNADKEFHQNEKRICLTCHKEKFLCQCENSVLSVPLYDIQIQEKKKKGNNKESRRWVLVEELQKCPRCGSSSKGETEIVTPISLYGSAPLANLTYELYRQLPPSQNKDLQKHPGEGRKLLTFYDSRQGAARFAAFLQDVANKQNYRHIIPKAIEIYKKENGFLPSLKGLSDKSVQLAFENRIIQNDPDIENFWRKSIKSLSREEKAEARSWIAAQILGEITTGSRQRQSLESVGLIGVEYFEDEQDIDFSGLESSIGLSDEQIKALIGYLLDDLRYQKAVILPFHIDQDDPVFGPNKGNPSVIRQGTANSGEIRWIGVTARQRRRQYIQLVLQRNDLDYSDKAVENTLNKLWDWLLEETDVLKEIDNNRYRLKTERFFFDNNLDWYRCEKCQRFSYRGTSLPCPFPHCRGNIVPVNIQTEQKKNYYYNLFNEDLMPIRVEEHTAQLDPKMGRDYQEYFKKGYINVLSCSTTFEMGIDLGDLQTVAMSNVPPTVANYQQRAGRAGRRTSGTAFILTWASGRPHDQAYYANPAEIIKGNVAVPYLLLENQFILSRHINAILLSLFLRFRKNVGAINLKQCGDFFDINLGTPQYQYLSEWAKQERDIVDKSLNKFSRLLDYKNDFFPQENLKNFLSELARVNDEHYQPVTKFYTEQIAELGEKSKDTTISATDYKENDRKQSHFRKLLDRLRKEKLINYLSNEGVLPSYSFPLHTVELLLPKEARNTKGLRLERDLRQAIREYAPGSEIVADKRVWRSAKPVFWKDAGRDLAYRICDNCHYLDVSEHAGKPLPHQHDCPVCGEPYEKPQKTFVIPDGFVADKNSGKPAKQYVHIGRNQMRSAILPIKNIGEQQIGDLINLAYEREGKILYVNEGKFGIGFQFSLGGFNFEQNKNKSRKRFSLGYIQTTDTLHIRFTGTELVKVPSSEDNSFWLSLMYALIHAASHSLQIERRDIGGVLAPRKFGEHWEQTIVLYDNVPGGAGHVKLIRDKIQTVIKDAIRVLNCNDCAPDTSCYHCLRDYNNQFFHHLLVRENALSFLEVVLSDLEPLDGEISGASRVVSTNPSMWLLRQIENAHLSVDIAVPELSFGHPLGGNYSWFDTFNNLLTRKCDLNIYLQQLPDQDAKGLSISKQLQVLMDKGLNLWEIEKLPKWQILIDRTNAVNNRAISGFADEYIMLGNDVGTKQLLTTIAEDGIENVYTDFLSLNSKSVTATQLDAPSNVKVINLHSSSKQYISIQELFADVFSKPCERMLINDPYLLDRKRINLLEPYLKLAVKNNSLESVIVHTKKARNFNEQKKAGELLNKKFENIIVFKYKPIEHDRYIELNRKNGEKARIIFGRGLDFMQPDGTIKSTFIVIQDPII